MRVDSRLGKRSNNNNMSRQQQQQSSSSSSSSSSSISSSSSKRESKKIKYVVFLDSRQRGLKQDRKTGNNASIIIFGTQQHKNKARKRGGKERTKKKVPTIVKPRE